MDVQLKELIDKIKSDGVKNAEENAVRILVEAETRAAKLMEETEAAAEKVRETVKVDVERSRRAGQEALRQAGRDLILTVRNEIERVFGILVKTEVGKGLTAELMSRLITDVIQGFDKSDDVTVLVPSGILTQVEEGLRAAMADRLASGVNLRPIKDIDAGFRVAVKDGSAFYDFSDAEISAMLARYLNPRLAELITD